MITEYESDGSSRQRGGAITRTKQGFRTSATEPWLMASKVSVPLPPALYVDRPRLFKLYERSPSQIIVVCASGGFGKTVLLSAICRNERECGTFAAWLSVDEDDSEDSIGLYLMYAFERAGLGVASAPSGADYRLNVLAELIENHRAPCLLLIDEAERLRGQAIDAVNFLLGRAPDNLRIVIGLRDNPGLDLYSAGAKSRDNEIGPDQLSFTRPEILRFFDDGLSRRTLAAVANTTHGWPIAVCVQRISQRQEAGIGSGKQLGRYRNPQDEVVTNWLSSRLLRFMSHDDRVFLQDLAQFDWIDPDFIDSVLNRTDTRRRLTDLRDLRGLMQEMNQPLGAQRLHPLLKKFCVAEREREAPERCRWLHGAIAKAMFKVGYLVPALRHAGDAGDAELVGSILEQAGGFQLWLQNGMTQLRLVEHLLTEDVTERFPRLALLHCRMLVQRSKLLEARSVYEKVCARTDDFTSDRSGGDVRVLRAEAVLICGTLSGYGCLPFGSEQIDDVAASLSDLKEWNDPNPLLIAGHTLLLVAAYHQRAQFELSSQFGKESEAHYRVFDSPQGAYHLALHYGIMAMAEGQVDQAEECYLQAARLAEQRFPIQPDMAAAANILLAELNLERSNLEPVHQFMPALPVPLRNPVAWLDIHIAANDVGAEWRLATGGIEDALFFIEKSQNAADLEGLISTVRHLSTLRIHYLLVAGLIQEATLAWRAAGLPEAQSDLLDLDGQSWREMEALCMTRLRLLSATGSRNAARRLAHRLVSVARKRGLTRTLMRCYALSMIIEHRAGDDDVAYQHLIDFLRLFNDTDYSRPLTREKDASRVLVRLLNTDIESDIRTTAESLLHQLDERHQTPSVHFSKRELEVLKCLGEGLGNKEIARRLELSVEGVRYHIKKIYRKTGALKRSEILDRAESAGVLFQRIGGGGGRSS